MKIPRWQGPEQEASRSLSARPYLPAGQSLMTPEMQYEPIGQDNCDERIVELPLIV